MASEEKMARKRQVFITNDGESDLSEISIKRPRSDACQEENEIQAVTKFDQALKKYQGKFESEIVALDFLINNGPSDQLAPFLNLIRQHRENQQHSKHPWSFDQDCKETKTILKSIFSRVSVPELKLLRIVTKLWCKLATPYLDSKTIVAGKCLQGAGSVERFRQGLSGQIFIPMAITWTGKTHRFRHVELDISREFWVGESLRNTMRSLFLNPSMYTVETLKISGYRAALFDQQYVTSIPSCLSKFWKNIKSLTFLNPYDYHGYDITQLQQEPGWQSGRIGKLEDIHIQVGCDYITDWTFIEICPKLKALELIFSSWNAEPDLGDCLGQILQKLKGKNIEALTLQFADEDDIDAVDAIANFVVTVSNKGTLKDVVYRISEHTTPFQRLYEHACLELIKKAPPPLKSAKFFVASLDQSTAQKIWEEIEFRGYLELETFEFSFEHKSVRKFKDQIVVSENRVECYLEVPKDISKKQGFLASLGKELIEHGVKAWQQSGSSDEPNGSIIEDTGTGVSAVTDEPCCASAKEIITALEPDDRICCQGKEMDEEFTSTMDAVFEFSNAITEYKCHFTSEENAACRLVHMKDSVWPNLSAFVWSCWSSQLYDREDWRNNVVVLDAVCEKLNISDIKVMRLVCKEWLSVVSPKLTKRTITTSTQKLYVPINNRERGVQVQILKNHVSPSFLDITRNTSISLRNLEINTSQIDWESSLQQITGSLFLNPATSALETLRIFGFHPEILNRQFLPYLIPKHLKQLKSLTLLWPLRSGGRKIDELESCSDITTLEKLTVNVHSTWRPSWKFLAFCPHLKCFKLLGRNILPTTRKYIEYLPMYSGSFVKCLEDVWPYLENKSIEKLGLKFSINQSVEKVADFVNKIAAKGTLQDATYEVDAVPASVSRLLNLLPLPNRRAKIVVDVGTYSCFRHHHPSFSTFKVNVLDQIESKGYLKLDRMDFRIVSYSLQRGDFDQRLKLSLLVHGSSVVFKKQDSLVIMHDLNLRRRYRQRFASWFPDMNYLCYPLQCVQSDGSKFTKLLEMAVVEGDVFHLPGVPRNKRGGFEDILFQSPDRCSEIQDASIIHRNAVCVPTTIRSKDLYNQECQTYIFGRVQLDEFKRVKDQPNEEKSGIEQICIEDWNLPAGLAMLREIETPAIVKSSTA